MSAFSALTDQDVKDYHGFGTGSTHNTQITLIRPLVESFILEYVRHDLESKTRTAEKPRVMVRQQNFYLKFRPVASITTLTENGEDLTEDEDFSVDLDTGEVEKISTKKRLTQEREFGSFWTTERNKIIITYVGGEAVTLDLRIIFFELVGMLSGIKKRTFINGEGIEQTVTLVPTNIPQDFLDILNRHRHTRI